MLRYLTIPVTQFQQNCSLVWCDQTLQAAVIDPGGDLERILAEVKRLGLHLEQIWLTHAHIDHAGGTAELAQRLQLPIIGPHVDRYMTLKLLGVTQNGAQQLVEIGFVAKSAAANPSPMRGSMVIDETTHQLLRLRLENAGLKTKSNIPIFKFKKEHSSFLVCFSPYSTFCK